MAIVRAESDANPTKPLGVRDAAIQGGRMTLVALGGATVIAAICAASEFAYLGQGDGYFFGFVLAMLAIGGASLRVMARARVPGLRMNLIGGVPLAAGIGGAAMKRYTRSASRAVKNWSAAVIAVVLIAAIAAGPLNFLPAGDGSTQHGQYVETNRGR